MLESLALLAGVLLLVTVGTRDVAQFFLKDPDTRRFWLKWWIVVITTLSIAIWGILLITGK